LGFLLWNIAQAALADLPNKKTGGYSGFLLRGIALYPVIFCKCGIRTDYATLRIQLSFLPLLSDLATQGENDYHDDKSPQWE